MTNPTSNFGWQMPTPTDLVTDLPADFEVFGQAVDNDFVDLLGGADGYILSKASATDLDFAWVTPASLTGFIGLPYIATQYYTTDGTQATNPLFAANITYYMPLFVRYTQTFDRISIVTSPGFVGTASVRLGIYNSDSAGVPSTVLLDAGLVAPTASSTTYDITISQTLSPGWYWLASNTVTAASTNYFRAMLGSSNINSADMGTPVPTGAFTNGYSQSVNASSSFATASSPTRTNSIIPYIYLRA